MIIYIRGSAALNTLKKNKKSELLLLFFFTDKIESNKRNK